MDAHEPADLHSEGDAGLCQEGDELWRITAQVNIMTDVNYSTLTSDIDEIVRSETRDVAGARHVVTGMVPLFLHTQQAVLTSLIESFALGAVISYVLRSLRSGLVTMIPNILPISAVFGAISWFGLAVDVGSMITASVALGIAVDGTLHLLTWFRQEIRNGRTRRVAIERALGHCGPALFQTSIVVGTGLVVTSRHGPNWRRGESPQRPTPAWQRQQQARVRRHRLQALTSSVPTQKRRNRPPSRPRVNRNPDAEALDRTGHRPRHSLAWTRLRHLAF